MLLLDINITDNYLNGYPICLTLIITTMKKFKFSVLFYLSLFLFSCENQNFDFEKDLPQPENQKELKSGGDGIYDILGYGYDCTESYFLGTMHSRLPVINATAYKNAGNIIYIDEVPNDITTKEKWGSSFSEFQKDITTDAKATITDLPIVGKLFSGYLKTVFVSNSKITNSTCFYEFDAKKVTRKVRFDQTDPSNFKNYLNSTFKYDVQTKSGIELVRKYGTHVLTDILLGGSSRVLFTAKLAGSTQTNSFKLESELTYKAVKLNGGTDNKTTTVSNHKDMYVYVWVMGGSKALEAGKLTFNPFDNSMSNLTFSYTEWLNSVDKTREQLIGIGNPYTKIYPLSEYIFDNPAKKKEVENAIIQYSNEKELKPSFVKTLDYETKRIMRNGKYLYWGTGKSGGIEVKKSYVIWDKTYDWTFYPEGNYYRIKGKDGFITRDLNKQIPKMDNQINNNNLWEIIKDGNYYQIKDPFSNYVMQLGYIIPPFIPWPGLKLELWNPNNEWQKIEIQ